MRPAAFVCVLAVLAVLSPCQAFCQAKHFFNSQEHFQEISTRAVALIQGLNSPGEVSFLNYYSSCGLVYSAKAYGLGQLAVLVENMRLPEDKALAVQQFLDSASYATGSIGEDLRVLEKMNTQNLSPAVLNLGTRLINELRVFQHNAQAFPP
ncbi:hypothetical protein JCM15519_36490 [Fundidesulfovibrio butyratiphilus]